MFKQNEKAVSNRGGYWLFGAISSKDGDRYSVRKAVKETEGPYKGTHTIKGLSSGIEGVSLFRPAEAISKIDEFLQKLREKEERLKLNWRKKVDAYNRQRWLIGEARASARQTRREAVEYLEQIGRGIVDEKD